MGAGAAASAKFWGCLTKVSCFLVVSDLSLSATGCCFLVAELLACETDFRGAALAFDLVRTTDREVFDLRVDFFCFNVPHSKLSSDF